MRRNPIGEPSHGNIRARELLAELVKPGQRPRGKDGKLYEIDKRRSMPARIRPAAMNVYEVRDRVAHVHADANRNGDVKQSRTKR